MKKPIEEEKVKILLVDDKKENLIAFEKTLAPLNLDVLKAQSGNEALKLVLEHDVAIVVLDVMMPIMDGFEVATLMHSNEVTRHIPIIFVTAINKSEKHMMQGLEAGAVDYLYKPIDPIALLSKVRIFVDLFKVKRQLEKTVQTLNEYQTQLKENNAKLKRYSEEDSLTRIHNRRYFEKKFTSILEAAKQHNRMVALIIFDIDNFKFVNDTYGHEAGDVLLKVAANHLLNSIRAYDIVTFAKELDAARLGGDEFVVIADDVGSIENACVIAKRILKAIETPLNYKGHQIVISASIGIACYPQVGGSLDELKRAADEAMYLAKQAGKNRFEVYSDDIRLVRQRKYDIERGLQDALQMKEFRIVYQPIINLKEEKIVGLEALLRWDSKKLGFLSAQEFLPIAEENKMILPINLWAIEQICKDYKVLKQESQFKPEIFAFSISAEQLQDENFKTTLLTQLNECQVPAKNFLFEMTESTLMQQTDVLYDAINKLNKKGIKFALDNFGTGYSSLLWLKKVPISMLKIDPAFVHAIPEEEIDTSIINAILSLATSLNLTVIAKGVETEDQLEYLKKTQCVLAQGSYFSQEQTLDNILLMLNKIKL